MSRSTSVLSLLVALAVVAEAPVVRAAPAAAPAPVAAPSFASAWSTSFEPSAVGSYVGDKKPNVMVVGATSASEEAAVALRAAIRTSKTAGLVMDAQAIGSTEGLDDKTIVERAKGQPVGQIVIVRVFEGGPGEPPSAILTFYRPDGTVATAITSTAGTPITASGGASASAGVSAAAAEAVSGIGDQAEKEAEQEATTDAKAQAQYDDQYLWFENWVGVSAQTGAVVAKWSNLKQGKYGADVRGGDFYRIIGRDDLLKRYNRRRAIRAGVGVPVTLLGVTLMTVGTVALMSNIISPGPEFGDDDPIRMGRSSGPPRISNVGAGVMTGVGLSVFIGGLIFVGVFKPHPTSGTDAKRLADEYNQGLRKKLGIKDRQASLRLSPAVGRQYTGFAISGRF